MPTSSGRRSCTRATRSVSTATSTARSRAYSPLRSALQTVGDIAPTAARGLNAVRGYDPGKDLPQVVSATAKTVKALDANNDDLRTLVSGAAATLAVTGRRGAEIRATLRSGPG